MSYGPRHLDEPDPDLRAPYLVRSRTQRRQADPAESLTPGGGRAELGRREIARSMARSQMRTVLAEGPAAPRSRPDAGYHGGGDRHCTQARGRRRASTSRPSSASLAGAGRIVVRGDGGMTLHRAITTAVRCAPVFRNHRGQRCCGSGGPGQPRDLTPLQLAPRSAGRGPPTRWRRQEERRAMQGPGARCRSACAALGVRGRHHRRFAQAGRCSWLGRPAYRWRRFLADEAAVPPRCCPEDGDGFAPRARGALVRRAGLRELAGHLCPRTPRPAFAVALAGGRHRHQRQRPPSRRCSRVRSANLGERCGIVGTPGQGSPTPSRKAPPLHARRA